MDIQTNHRVTLLNAKCNYVCAVDTLVKKSNYGEDIGCCIEKLYLASRLINRLECFCFGTINATEVLSVFTITVPENNTAINTSASILANGIQIVSYPISGPTYKPTLVAAMLDSTTLSYVITSAGGFSTFTITAGCDIVSLDVNTVKGEVIVEVVGVNTVVGACTDICHNCIEDSDLTKMYEVLHKLLQ